ncbi:MAG: hypothetical protein JNK82_13705 [Myxococcaceae bacterium]|nr:hypothetical protein [Myxococcaceae bacterium]
MRHRAVLMLTVVSGLAFAAEERFAEDPAPPSTGNELPRAPSKRLPTQLEARVELERILNDAKSPKRDCKALISPWTRLMLALARPSTSDIEGSMESYLQLARCAEKQKYYVLLGDIGDLMFKANFKKGHPELLARAFVGLNSPQLALKVLEKAEADLPKDPEIALTTAKVRCRTREWDKCLAAADKTVKLVKKPTSPEGKETLNRAHKYRARALLHTGKLDVAAKAITQSEKLGGDKDDLAEVKKALVPAKQFKAVIETDHQPIVALGIYHLMGKKGGAKGLVRFYIANIGADRQFRVEANIEGVTVPLSKTETVLKGQPAELELTPQLAPGFDLAGMGTPRPGQLDLKVVAIDDKGEKVIYQASQTLELEPRDFLPTATFVDEEKAMSESHSMYMAAWVTPNAKAIEAFLTEAKSRAPRNTFSGEQSATIPQVKALFDTLKARGVSYVMNPEMLSGAGYGQRARLPGDVLTSTNAQCLEGAILYATLLEAIGLQPAIVLVPGHAFVGWKASPGDVEFANAWRPPAPDAGTTDRVGPAEVAIPDAGADLDSGVAVAEVAPPKPDAGTPRPPPNPYARAKTTKWLFLETTMTHDAAYETAVLVGGREYDGALVFGRARLLILPDLRKLGIAPQPYP